MPSDFAMPDDLTKLQKLLDDTHQWPCRYTFKFIGPANTEQQLIDLFPGHPAKRRASRNGKYVSITVEASMNSSAEVLARYAAARKIEGVIAL